MFRYLGFLSSPLCLFAAKVPFLEHSPGLNILEQTDNASFQQEITLHIFMPPHTVCLHICKKMCSCRFYRRLWNRPDKHLPFVYRDDRTMSKALQGVLYYVQNSAELGLRGSNTAVSQHQTCCIQKFYL